jgi:hypothetical protein
MNYELLKNSITHAIILLRKESLAGNTKRGRQV